MKIAGITRVRNEELIIKNTLDHVSQLVDEIYVYDDCSTDNTVKICKSHRAVRGIIEGKTWSGTPEARKVAEGYLRQEVYQWAASQGNQWVYCFDADEYIEFENIDFSADCYHFRLFDFYITEHDKNLNYLERKFMGPEFREIAMLFRVSPELLFKQRTPLGIAKSKMGGYVKHYGKAVSIEEWEKTCDYYVNHRWKDINQTLQEVWKSRKGKAIHSKSDFNRDFITWEDRNGYISFMHCST